MAFAMTGSENASPHFDGGWSVVATVDFLS